MERRILSAGLLLVAVLAVNACSSSNSEGSGRTSGASGDTGTTAGGGGGGQSGAGSARDLCTIVTPDVVQAQTGTAVTRSPDNAQCQYNGGPNGIFLTATSTQLSRASQAAFDAYVKAQESAGTQAVPGLGDGTGAAATHDINVTTYGFRGTTAVAITVFESTDKATTDGKTLAEKVLAAL